MSAEAAEEARLQRLIAELKRQDQPEPRPTSRRPSAWRGFFDLLAVLAAAHALVATTPAAELMVRAARWVSGRPAPSKPLASYFTMDHPGAPDVATLLEEARASVSAPPEALRSGVTADVLEGLSVMTAGLPEIAAPAFRAVGAPWPASDPAAVADALSRLAERLGGPEAAVAAALVGFEPVAHAVDRARAAGEAEPARHEAFRRYLPPDARREADALVRGTFALAIAASIRWPVDDAAAVSSPFGWRTHPVLGVRRLHGGTDLAVPIGTAVHAIASGRVLAASSDAVNGRFVRLDHGHGLTSTYCHASELLVARGDEVTAGQLLGRSGATGRVTGPHLHFQIEIEGEPVDPERFRPQRPSGR